MKANFFKVINNLLCKEAYLFKNGIQNYAHFYN